MTRSFSPRVEGLEDRCVPSADPVTPIVATPPDPSVVVVVPPPTFVIDPYLIDPNTPALPPKPVDVLPIPDAAWQQPQSLVPPIGDPFWY